MQIDRSEIISTTPVDLCLASHVVHLLDLPSTDLMDIEVNLDQLILYESGGHYKRDLDSKKEPCMYNVNKLDLFYTLQFTSV